MGYSRGDSVTLWVIAEGILPLCGLQQRVYCYCLSVRKGILPLYGLHSVTQEKSIIQYEIYNKQMVLGVLAVRIYIGVTHLL